jgi:hypothetical protein
VRIVAVEPQLGDRIHGLKNVAESRRPRIFDASPIDETG